MNGATLTRSPSHAALLEALTIVRAAQARIEALGFEASVLDIHAISRTIFDQLPGDEEYGQFGDLDPFWSKRVGGVNVYCDEPPATLRVEGRAAA